MGNTVFISPEFSLAIQNYLATKDQPLTGNLSFPVIIIRTLVFIYGELDIINPYITKNENMLGGFDSNLTKYGINIQDINDFKIAFNNFFKTQNIQNGVNNSFIKVEEYLIKMFFKKMKVMHLNNDDLQKFSSYICLSSNAILKDYYTLYASGTNELEHFFKSQLFLIKHDFNLVKSKKNLLYLDAYVLLGYSKNQVMLMNDEELNKLNEQVYSFFRIPRKEVNKEDLLIKAVNYYKKYGNRLTTGNGYVDLLLLSSIIITTILVLIVVGFRVF